MACRDTDFHQVSTAGQSLVQVSDTKFRADPSGNAERKAMNVFRPFRKMLLFYIDFHETRSFHENLSRLLSTDLLKTAILKLDT